LPGSKPRFDAISPPFRIQFTHKQCFVTDVLAKFNSLLTAEFRKVHQFMVYAVSTPMQHALANFLDDPSHWQSLPDFYQHRRDHFRAGLAASKFKLLPCAGTYFQLANYSAISNLSELEFARWLITEHGVACIPVSAFYETPTEQHLVRFCFGKKNETLDRAIEKLLGIRGQQR
jgi:methionine transaminase